MTEPTPDEAARLVRTADRLGSAMRNADRWRPVAWLTGMAVATVLYLGGLGIAVDGTAVDDTAVLVHSGLFGACVAVLCVALLPGARSTPAGFPRRFGLSVGTWGLVFGVVLAVGLLLPGGIGFWVAGALAAAVPLVLGVRAEVRA